MLDLADADPGVGASQARLSGFRTHYDTAALVSGPEAHSAMPRTRPETALAGTSDHTARDSGPLEQGTRTEGQLGRGITRSVPLVWDRPRRYRPTSAAW